VGVVGRWVDARLDHMQLDGEIIAEQSDELIVADVVGGVEPLVFMCSRCSSSRSW
jgi:hypothetical protein